MGNLTQEYSMDSFFFAQTLMLALFAGGVNDTDLVTLIQPKQYFEARQVRISIDSMIDIAITEPKDNKTQVRQLTALRYLTDESDAFKKASNYATNREAIEEIAQGKRAQDKAGFAKEYAQRMLDKLDGKKPAKAKVDAIRPDALNWFPADTTLAGAFNLRAGADDADGKDPVKELLKIIPERDRVQMYDVLEKVGNVRLERIAFSYSEGNGMRDGRFILRVTGKASQDGMIELFNALPGGGRMTAKKIKTDDDTPVMLLQEPDPRGPVVMLVGSTDLLIVAAEDRNNAAAKREALVLGILEARVKKKDTAATGKLKARLAKLPEKSVGFLVGELPAEMKQALNREFDALPNSVFAHVERTKQGLQVQGEGVMANAEDAGKLVQKIGALRKEAIMEIQQAMQQPLPPGSPPIPFQGIINVMNGMQVQSQGDKVNASVTVPGDLIQQVPLMLMPRRLEIDDIKR
jgi:hypothetical protein